MRHRNLVVKGTLMALLSGTLWGVSGTCGEFLFDYRGFSSQWTVTIRLLIGGMILLLLGYRKEKRHLFEIFKSKQDLFYLLIFSVFGMMAVQYTYFITIDLSNAPTATVLQYLCTVMIVVYYIFRNRRPPSPYEALAVACALLGTFFLVTSGNLNSLAISMQALLWGLLAAVVYAFYTIYPIDLMKRWSFYVIVGWGMLIGGIVMCFIYSPWDFQGHWDIMAVIAFMFIVVLGSALAFSVYLESVKYIGPTKASLCACIEPLSSAFFGVVWLKTFFTPAQWFGAFLIIITIFLVSYRPEKRRKPHPSK